jgi:hypothetical protein
MTPEFSDEQPRHTVLPGLLDQALIDHLQTYTDILVGAGMLHRGGQVPGSLKRYGDPGFDAVLVQVLPAVSRAVGTELLPTYSYIRQYERGQELVPHTDRPACEHSVTVHLASSTTEPWPIWLRQGRGVPVQVDLAPGDGLVYEGMATLHWRDPLAQPWYRQLFLHYVAATGGHRDEVYDGRPGLGLPSARSGTSG